MLCAHKVTLGKAFSRFSTVFGVFEWISYKERIDVTSPFLCSSLLKETNRYTKYLFVTSVRSYFKINFSFFFFFFFFFFVTLKM